MKSGKFLILAIVGILFVLFAYMFGYAYWKGSE